MKLVADTWKQDDCTSGRLFVMEGEETLYKCFTLELPWIDNKSSVSCIPEGTYKCRKHSSPSLGPVIHILDVDGRTWIYIHKGNFTYQIEGCMLVGTGIGYIDSDSIPDVSNSTTAFNKLMELLPDEFEIEITRT